MAARTVSPWKQLPSNAKICIRNQNAAQAATQKNWSKPALRRVIARAGAVTELESIEAFENFIGQDGVVVVDFYTTWCGPCKIIAPRVEEMAEELVDAKFGKINLTDLAGGGAFTKEREIKALPTFHIYKGGAMHNKMTGNDPKGLYKMVTAALN